LKGAVGVLLLAIATTLSAQTRGAELIKQPKPVYPEALKQAIAQGNVILIGRIDKNGSLQDIKAVWTTHEQFVEPTITAARAWVFRPALKDGRPIDIAANVVFPFRINDDQGKAAGRELPGPAISELAVFPADAAGKSTAPEGFAIRQGGDPRLRVEAAIDVAPLENPRKLVVRVEAISPTGKAFPVFEDALSVPGKGTRVKVAFSTPIGRDWEDGVWMLRFKGDKRLAGTGQFWLARDPGTFDFAAALRKK
jgi:hypothetical protein